MDEEPRFGVLRSSEFLRGLRGLQCSWRYLLLGLGGTLHCGIVWQADKPTDGH